MGGRGWTGHILGTLKPASAVRKWLSIGILFIEGIAVDDTARQNGIGTALVETAAQWAKTQGISELASDAL